MMTETSRIARSQGMSLQIERLNTDKKRELSLLLLADEQEDMIDRYLSRGVLYRAREDGVTLSVCVVTDEGDGVFEVKNLAVDPAYQGHGIGRIMLEYVAQQYAGKGRVLRVGTGAGTSNERFYERCGFVRTDTIPNFFIDHYDHEIIEDGVLLRDMAIFERAL